MFNFNTFQYKYFRGIGTMEEVKVKWKALAVEHHPDKGGNGEILKEINAEYTHIKKVRSFPVPGFVKDAGAKQQQHRYQQPPPGPGAFRDDGFESFRRAADQRNPWATGGKTGGGAFWDEMFGTGKRDREQREAAARESKRAAEEREKRWKDAEDYPGFGWYTNDEGFSQWGKKPKPEEKKYHSRGRENPEFFGTDAEWAAYKKKVDDMPIDYHQHPDEMVRDRVGMVDKLRSLIQMLKMDDDYLWPIHKNYLESKDIPITEEEIRYIAQINRRPETWIRTQLREAGIWS